MLCTVSLAQEAVHYSFSQGLPSSFVHQVDIQADGSLLIATQKGLVQFDGYRFIRLPFSNSNVPSMVIKGPYIYFHDFKTGLVQYNGKLHKRNPLSFLNYEDTVSYNDHYDNLFVDAGDRVWCTDFEAVKFLDPVQKTWKRLLIQPGNKGSFRAFFHEYAKGKIVIITTLGLYEWDHDRQQLTTVNKQSFTCFAKISNNELLLGEGKCLYRYAKGQYKIRKVATLPQLKRIQGLTTMEDRFIIVNDQSCLYWLELPAMQVQPLLDLEDKIIQSTRYDSVCQTLWIATDRGLSKLHHMRNNEAGIQRLGINRPEKITSIATADDGSIWLAGDHFLGFLDARKVFHDIPVPKLHIHALSTADQQLFLCTSSGLFEIKNQRVRPTKIPTGVKKMAIDAKGNYWVIDLQHKVQVFDAQGRATPKFLANQPAHFWKDNTWNDLYIDHKGQIWLAGHMPKSFGIACYHPSKQQFIDITGTNQKSDFIGDYYNRIAVYNSDHLLFSGYGGFNIVSLDGKITRKVDALSHPLQNEHLEGLCADAKGNVWFGTAEGLHFWHAGEDKITVLTEIDGLASNDLTHGFSPIGDTGLAVGATRGLTLLHTGKALNSNLRNRLELTAIKIDDEIQLSPADTIVLSPSQRNISFLFSARNDEQKERCFDNDKIKKGPWIQLNHNPEIDFNQIEPGRYTILISVQDNLGQIQPKSLRLYLVVQPPFFKTLGFNLLVLFSAIILVGLMISAFFRRKRKIDLLSSKIKEVEMQTLRSQMNPHFLFNSLNSIKGFVLEQKTEMASAYLTKFSKLMRNILENSRLPLISLEKELQTLTWYIQLEAARLEHNFDYHIFCSKELDAEYIMVPPLLLQPFVENAIWHGLRTKQNGMIDISVTPKEKNFISIKIKDNGIGRIASAQQNKNQNKERPPLGMTITRERLEVQHHKNQLIITDLIDDNQQACGTLVELIIFSEYD